MLYTGNYNNCKCGNVISISGDKGKSLGYEGKACSILSPKLSFWKVWHNNIGILTETENNDFYIERYYNLVLSSLNAKQVYEELKGDVLLCYEEPLEFCHRHIVATWLENELGIFVPEVALTTNGIVELDRNESIREDYKKLILK